MGYLRALDMAHETLRGNVTMDVALYDHLTANTFPPTPMFAIDEIIELSRTAIQQYAEEDYDAEIDLPLYVVVKNNPKIRKVTVSEFIEIFRLEGFANAALFTTKFG